MFIVIFDILGQGWYFIVSIPDPCCLSYFNSVRLNGTCWVLFTLLSTFANIENTKQERPTLHGLVTVLKSLCTNVRLSKISNISYKSFLLVKPLNTQFLLHFLLILMDSGKVIYNI